MNFLEYFYDQIEKVVKPTKALYYQPTELIFLLIVKDYFYKKIDLHFLASGATQLYFQLNKPSFFDSNPSAQKLGNILSEISEIEYYFEKNKEKYELFLGKLKEYYEENKKLLNTLNAK